MILILFKHLLSGNIYHDSKRHVDFELGIRA